MLIRVASKASSTAHHLLVKIKAAAVIGLLDAQQQIIDPAFAEQQKQAAACRHDQELSAIAADAKHSPVDDAVCKSSGPAPLNSETMSILRSADGITQAGGSHSSQHDHCCPAVAACVGALLSCFTVPGFWQRLCLDGISIWS